MRLHAVFRLVLLHTESADKGLVGGGVLVQEVPLEVAEVLDHLSAEQALVTTSHLADGQLAFVSFSTAGRSHHGVALLILPVVLLVALLSSILVNLGKALMMIHLLLLLWLVLCLPGFGFHRG